MTHRMPSLIVVSLAIIMFLLASFYMTCSSTTAELRQTLGAFEHRVRLLTVKNNDQKKEIEMISANKLVLEEERVKIQKQMEKKDSEVNHLNRKLQKKRIEVRSLKVDQQVLGEQLKDLKNMTDEVAAKNSLIEQLQRELDEQKKANEQQINDLEQQVENYKQQLNQPLVSNERFPPLMSSNETIGNSSTSVQQLADELRNNTQNIDRNEKIPDAEGQGLSNPYAPQSLQRTSNDSLDNIQPANETHPVMENIQNTINLTSIANITDTNFMNNQTKYNTVVPEEIKLIQGI